MFFVFSSGFLTFLFLMAMIRPKHSSDGMVIGSAPVLGFTILVVYCCWVSNANRLPFTLFILQPYRTSIKMSDLMQAIHSILEIYEKYSQYPCPGQSLKPAEMEQLIQVELSDAIKVSQR